MKRYLTWGLMPFSGFVLLAFFFWRGLDLDPQNLPSARLGQPLPVFNAPLLYDETQLFSPAALKGTPLILHVFASWCTSCAKEQVFLLKLKARGVPLYGLDYKDTPDEAKAWLNTWGNPYKIIVSDLDGRIGIELGVYGTPETFLVDRAGVIRYRHVGPLNADIWEKTLQPKWQALL